MDQCNRQLKSDFVDGSSVIGLGQSVRMDSTLRKQDVSKEAHKGGVIPCFMTCKARHDGSSCTNINHHILLALEVRGIDQE